MTTIRNFVLGGLFGLLAILGLLMAAHLGSSAGYWIGILIFLGAIGLLFAQITEAAASGLPLPVIVRNLAKIRQKGTMTMKGMSAMEKFFWGGVLGLFAIISLFAASRHGEGASYWGGLGVFAIMIGLIFYMITSARFGESDGAH